MQASPTWPYTATEVLTEFKKTVFGKKNNQKFGHFKKTSYLCIAFEGEHDSSESTYKFGM